MGTRFRIRDPEGAAEQGSPESAHWSLKESRELGDASHRNSAWRLEQTSKRRSAPQSQRTPTPAQPSRPQWIDGHFSQGEEKGPKTAWGRG